MSLKIGKTEFDGVSYDAEVDVLYLHVGDPGDAVEFDASSEGHALRYDELDRLVGITILNARWTLEQNDSVVITTSAGRLEATRAGARPCSSHPSGLASSPAPARSSPPPPPCCRLLVRYVLLLHGHGLLFISSGGVLSYGASVAIDPAAAACHVRVRRGVRNRLLHRRRVLRPPVRRQVRGMHGEAQDERRRRRLRCRFRPATTSRGVASASSASRARRRRVRDRLLRARRVLRLDLHGPVSGVQPGRRLGLCSPINEGACGAACDGDHTIKQTGAPDVDCAPFKCEGSRCKNTCASVKDCAAPSVCSLEGQCAAPAETTPGSGGVCGCKVVGGGGQAAASAHVSGALFALAVAALFARLDVIDAGRS